MAVFNEPTKWAQALGATANADVIPDEAEATDVDISKIFPAVFSVPLSQGGKAIPRRTLNGILKLLGDWLFYYQTGGVPSYNADFDYAVGRVVLHNGKLWHCLKQNGADDPQTPAEGEYWTECLVKSSVLDNIYPVGSIYISVNSTNPGALFGGTWEQIQEKFLLSAGDTHTAGTTGGEFTHTLTTAEMPVHNHTASSDSTGAHTHTRGTMEIYGAWNRFWSEYDGTAGAVQVTREEVGWLGHDVANVHGNADFYASRDWSGATSENGAHTHTITVNNNGSGSAHNNTPPYLAVYMWKRIA